MPSSLPCDLDILQECRHYNQWIYDLLEPYLSGVVLDIGSGLGSIASLFIRPQIEEVILSEFDENLVARLRQLHLPLRKYRVLILDITHDEAVAKLKGERIDTVTCVNVLEHIEDDIGALQRISRILKPEGKLAIFVPALSCVYGTLDSCYGHQRRYTQKTLKTKMQAAGFHIEAWRYINFFGIITWFLAGHVLKQKKIHKKTCYYLDKIVPLLRTLERGFRPFSGQSLLMIGRNSLT